MSPGVAEAGQEAARAEGIECERTVQRLLEGDARGAMDDCVYLLPARPHSDLVDPKVSRDRTQPFPVEHLTD